LKGYVVGRLGKEPELKTKGSVTYAQFSIAEDQGKDRDGNKLPPQWYEVTVFGKLAQVCEKHLAKGSMALVDGKLKIRTYQDKQGRDRFSAEINADTVKILTWDKNESQEQKPSPQSNADEGYGGSLDDIPF